MDEETTVGNAIDLGPLASALGYVLRRAQLSVFADFHATFAELDLRPAEFSVLVVIGRNPGLRQNQVGDLLGIQSPNIAAIVKRFVARGWTARQVSAHDRRAAALFLKAEGEEMLARAVGLWRQHERRICERLEPGERECLLTALTRLSDKP